MQSKNNVSFLYIFSIILAAVLTVIVFCVFFLSDKLTPVFDKVMENKSNTEISSNPTENKLTVSQDSDNYKALVDKYTNYLNSSYLIVVNKDNPLPEDYKTMSVSSVENSARQLETRAAEALSELFAAANEAGYKKHVVISGYRTEAEQETAFNTKLKSFMDGGYTATEAETKATAVVAKPGCSEFQTGLLVEIAETRNMTSEDFASTELFTFLKENAHRYGFILRYPENKSNVTGYDFNSMVFRYVGSVESSTYIYENNLTLEEYIDYLKIAKLYAEQKLQFVE